MPLPASAMPTAPAGFSVSLYAELQGPRMMVYAPNGDLFVSSPTTNSITVLRDTNGDGTFEERGVFAQGEVPAAARRWRGAAWAEPGPVGHRAIAPATAPVNPEINGPILGASAPACTPPPPFNNPGPGHARGAVRLGVSRRLSLCGQHRRRWFATGIPPAI